MSKVVNLYKNKYDIYIGRQGKGQDGYFGNPIKLNEECSLCSKIHKENGDTLECFSLYFYAKLELDKEFKNKVDLLKGKVLGCFCKPKPCHGDIMIEYLNHL